MPYFLNRSLVAGGDTWEPGEQYWGEKERTDNLMDYAGGSTLNNVQWGLVHNPDVELFKWLQGEEENEFRNSHSIRWLGDRLLGYAKDSLESKIENKMILFNDVTKNYESYYEESSSKDTVIYDGWSIRQSSHKIKIGKSLFDKISKQEAPKFRLHEKGVFFEKFKLEDADYTLAVYSYCSSVQLNASEIKITSYSDLADNKNIKLATQTLKEDTV